MGALSAFGVLRWRQYVIAVLGVIGLLLSSIGAQSAPVTSEQYFSGSNNTSISSRLTAVGDKIKFELVSAPSHGMIVLNANGAFTYTPVAGFTGDDS